MTVYADEKATDSANNLLSGGGLLNYFPSVALILFVVGFLLHFFYSFYKNWRETNRLEEIRRRMQIARERMMNAIEKEIAELQEKEAHATKQNAEDPMKIGPQHRNTVMKASKPKGSFLSGDTTGSSRFVPNARHRFSRYNGGG